MEKKFKPYKGFRWRTKNDPKKREEAIKNNIPVLFEIKRDINQLKKLNWLDDVWNIDKLGKNSVRKYDGQIQNYSKKHNIDPDIVRSVMFAENARGHKLGWNSYADREKKSESPLPMNIQKNRWASLVDKEPDDLYDPDNNIEASTVLLRRIADRIDKLNAAKIGSIWHYIGRENTDEFGEYIGQIYEKKPWRIID